jgi:hypothetical protein
MKSTIVTISILSVLAISGCGLGTQSILDGPVSTTRMVGPLEFKLELPKRVFKSGELIPAKMTVKNTTDAVIFYGFSSRQGRTLGIKKNDIFYAYSGSLPFGVLVPPPYTRFIPANAEVRELWDWDQDVIELGGFHPVLLAPSEKVPPGRYLLTGWMSAKVGVRADKIVSSSGSFTYHYPDEASYPKTAALTEWEAEPIEIEILPPGTP